jgi:hypothetical protein
MKTHESKGKWGQWDVVSLTQMGMLAAVAVVLVLFIRFPIIPSVPFIEYDMADVPVLIGALLYGPLPGLAILFVVSFIQAFFLGGNGWVGFVMHMLASGVMVLLASLLYRRKPSLPWLAAGLGCGAAARTLMMIPMNLIFTVHFFGVPHDVVVSLLLPGIIPMNLIISVVNCLLAGLLFKALRPVLEKFRSRWMRA